MKTPIERHVETLENMLHRTHAVLLCHIAAMALIFPGSGNETALGLRHQADAARHRGDRLAAVMLDSAADEVSGISGVSA